jgi:DNA-binding XRE family transcriptional regulator
MVLLKVCRLIVINILLFSGMCEKLNSSRLRKHFALNLKRLRMRCGLSQEALASEAGLHRTYIGSIERGERNVSIDNIERIAVALGVSPTSLLEDPMG